MDGAGQEAAAAFEAPDEVEGEDPDEEPAEDADEPPSEDPEDPEDPEEPEPDESEEPDELPDSALASEPPPFTEPERESVR